MLCYGLKKLHFWPFDGWEVPESFSVVAEVYPSLWSKGFPKKDRTQDQHDAYSVASWLRNTDSQGMIDGFFKPELNHQEEAVGKVEGWILGIM